MASHDITGLLRAWQTGDHQALDQLMPLVHEELRRLAQHYMAGERRNHPLQATALVNETYLRLVGAGRVRWQDRRHFFAVAAQLMRRVLVDVARERQRLKRGGDAIHVPIDDVRLPAPASDAALLALNDALDALARFDLRKSRVVELRYFGGLTVAETAAVLNVSPITVMRDWDMARSWLLRELEPRT